MKSKELRVGNLFDYLGQTVIALNVLSGEKSDFGYFEDSVGFLRGYSDDDCPTAILLTEEWLIKLGFTRDGSYWSHPYINLLVVHTVENKEVIMCPNTKYASIIKYVHQLQNLYFVLTGGQELKLKDES